MSESDIDELALSEPPPAPILALPPPPELFRLVKILENPQALKGILATPTSNVSDRAKGALSQIYKHWLDDDDAGIDTDADVCVDDVDNVDNDEAMIERLMSWGQDITPQRKQMFAQLRRDLADIVREDGVNSNGKRPNTTDHGKGQKRMTQSPWKAVTNLTALTLPKEIIRHLQASGTDAAPLLGDHTLITHPPSEQPDLAIEHALVASYDYVSTVTNRLQLDRSRWLFGMVMIFDIVKLVCPESTGKRIGRKMEQRLQPAFDDTRFDFRVARADFAEWSLIGHRLHQLCEELGGVHWLFFLESVLTEGFLKNRITANGAYHRDAIAHLRDLEQQVVPETLEDARMLAQNMRDCLVQPFAAAHEAQNAD